MSGDRFINKMSFGPTLFSQNYPDDPGGEIYVVSKFLALLSIIY